MKSIAWKRFWIFAVLSLAWVLAGCGGSSSNVAQAPAPAAVSVAVRVNPNSATVDQGATMQFTATVTGSAIRTVTWSVQEAAGGAVTSDGLYTAPAANGTFHVIATSQADSTKTAIAIATVVPPPVVVSIPTGSMAGGRHEHTATRLADGRVLVVGGFGAGTLSSAEIYDPASGTFSPTGAMNSARWAHTATLLGDGKVLIAGGSNADAEIVLTAEIYDPVSGTFSQTGSMATPRTSHTATLLANGTVLITGGFLIDNFEPALGTAEIYDPATGAFASAGQMQVPRHSHSASLLLDGQVLLAGGVTNTNSGEVTSTAELYDPSTGMFFVTGSMTSLRAGFVTAVLLDGKVFVIGGRGFNNVVLTTAEVYDPGTGSFFNEGAMNQSRSRFAGVTLLDGSVLISGGSDSQFSPMSSVEVYSPQTHTFELIGRLIQARAGHTATVLTDGRVLLIGGSGGTGALATVELYIP